MSAKDTQAFIRPDGVYRPGQLAKLGVHPAAEIFPLMVGAERDRFFASVKANGVIEPLVLYKGELLDGRNRRDAACAARLSVAAVEYFGDDPLGFVIARNLDRRQLNESQRATCAARTEGFTHGGVRAPVLAKGEAQSEATRPIKREEAAALWSVSERSVASAAKVLKSGSETLINAMDSGAVAVSVAVQAVGMEPAEQTRVVEAISSGKAKTAKQVIKRHNKKVRDQAVKAEVIALPEMVFPIIYADPEWEHETWSESGQDRSASMHYRVSADSVILGRPVGAIAHKHAGCFLWATVPHLPLALACLAAWGFEYKSHVIWHKDYGGERHGLGYWARIDHEILLIGTRGDFRCPVPGDNWSSVQRSKVGRHSEKPEWAYRLIEEYHGEFLGHMIELNARARRPGWHSWGDAGYLPPPRAGDDEAEEPGEVETPAPGDDDPRPPKRGEPIKPNKGQPDAPAEGAPAAPQEGAPGAPVEGHPIAPHNTPPETRERGKPAADDLEIPAFLKRSAA